MDLYGLSLFEAGWGMHRRRLDALKHGSSLKRGSEVCYTAPGYSIRVQYFVHDTKHMMIRAEYVLQEGKPGLCCYVVSAPKVEPSLETQSDSTDKMYYIHRRLRAPTKICRECPCTNGMPKMKKNAPE